MVRERRIAKEHTHELQAGRKKKRSEWYLKWDSHF